MWTGELYTAMSHHIEYATINISKVVERVVADQLQALLDETNTLGSFPVRLQAAPRHGNSLGHPVLWPVEGGQQGQNVSVGLPRYLNCIWYHQPRYPPREALRVGNLIWQIFEGSFFIAGMQLYCSEIFLRKSLSCYKEIKFNRHSSSKKHTVCWYF